MEPSYTANSTRAERENTIGKRQTKKLSFAAPNGRSTAEPPLLLEHFDPQAREVLGCC